MKVILTKDKTIRDVSDGYARNYLLPKGLAIIATPQEIAKRDLELKIQEQRRKDQDIDNLKQKAEYEDKNFKIEVEKIGENGKLFGSITAKDIATAVNIPKENILLKEPIKNAGEHQIELKFGQHHTHITVTISERRSK